MGMLLCASAVGLTTIEAALYRLHNKKCPGKGFAFNAIASFFSMLFFLFTDKNGLVFPKEMLVYGISNGVLASLGAVFTYIAIASGSFALSLLILSYAMIFNVVYGILFLGEAAGFFTYLGLLMILLSLWLTREKADGEKKKLSAKWFISVILATVCTGITGVISRMQQIRFDNACTNEYMMVSLVVCVITLVVAGIAGGKRDFALEVRRGGLIGTGAGVVNGAANSVILLVNLFMPISISSPIMTGLKTVVSFGVSKVFLGENFIARQIIGAILGAVAVILLKI